MMETPKNNDPDRELVQRCQVASPSGLEGCFRELYDGYKDRVYNVCYRITGNGNDALDAAQETFSILFRKIEGFRFQSKFSSWVYRIAVNASIDLKRRAANRRLASLDQLSDVRGDGSRRMDPVDDRAENPVEAAATVELEQEVQAAISRLSPKMRAITVLRYMQGLSYVEIANSLGISLGTVKSRLARAHQALDRELTPTLDRHGLR
jgi:RNA polymerase sigma-70 factor (ECF subfamily)